MEDVSVDPRCKGVKANGDRCKIYRDIQDGWCLFHDPDRSRHEAWRGKGAAKTGSRTLPETLEGVEKARAHLYKQLTGGKIDNASAKIRLTILHDQERSLRDPLRVQVKEMTKQITQLRKAMGR